MDEKVTKVIVHCSDSSFGNAATIAKWHVLPPPQGRGWSFIGYHLVILNGWLSFTRYHHYFDGYIETGRALDDDATVSPDEYGAHATGFNDCIGICLIGLSGNFSEKQIIMLRQAIRMLREQYGKILVEQHSDVDPVNRPHCAGLSADIMKQLNMVA